MSITRTSELKGLYEGTEPYIFVSYRHEDEAKVAPIVSRLIDDGCRVWLDCGISTVGTNEWKSKLVEKINGSAVFMMMMTQSYQNSPHCISELDCAQDKNGSFITEPCIVMLEDTEFIGQFAYDCKKYQHMEWFRYEDKEEFFKKLYAQKPMTKCLDKRRISLEKRLERVLPSALEALGSSETLGQICSIKPRDHEELRNVSAFAALEDTVLRVVAECVGDMKELAGEQEKLYSVKRESAPAASPAAPYKMSGSRSTGNTGAQKQFVAWNKEEEQEITEMFLGGKTVYDIANEDPNGRTVSAIISRLLKIGTENNAVADKFRFLKTKSPAIQKLLATASKYDSNRQYMEQLGLL